MDEVFRHSECTVATQFDISERVVVYPGDCLELLRAVPDGAVQLVVTSPPYNIGKEYEPPGAGDLLQATGRGDS